MVVGTTWIVHGVKQKNGFLWPDQPRKNSRCITIANDEHSIFKMKCRLMNTTSLLFMSSTLANINQVHSVDICLIEICSDWSFVLFGRVACS